MKSGLRPTVSGGWVKVVPCGGETTVFEAIDKEEEVPEEGAPP